MGEEWGKGGGRRGGGGGGGGGGRGVNNIIPLYNSQFIPLSGMQIGSVPGKQPETKPDQPECKLFLISLNTDFCYGMDFNDLEVKARSCTSASKERCHQGLPSCTVQTQGIN